MKAFSLLMLNIKHMSNEDKLFNFISKLQPCTQIELQVVRDLLIAIAITDRLMDYMFRVKSEQNRNKGKKKKHGPSKSGGRKKERESSQSKSRK